MKDILNKIENNEFLNPEQVQIIRDNILTVARHFNAEDITILDFNNGYKIDINDNIYFNLNSDELLEIGLEVLY
ncbi:MAG: hypothetical protein ACRCXT_23680 [Paraclostridium sp.]